MASATRVLRKYPIPMKSFCCLQLLVLILSLNQISAWIPRSISEHSFQHEIIQRDNIFKTYPSQRPLFASASSDANDTDSLPVNYNGNQDDNPASGRIPPPSSTFLKKNRNTNKYENDMMDAAAAVTQQSCRLLGIKSLGVDYGLVRTGLATTVGYEAKPLQILATRHNNVTELCAEIVALAASEQVQQIIVGLPLHKNGTEANQTVITRQFAQQLTQQVRQQLGPSIPVKLWDERYTSKYAKALVHSVDPSRQLYGLLDADAAGIILDDFYRKNGVGAQDVILSDTIERKCRQVWQQRQDATQLAQDAAQQARLVGGSRQRKQQAMERARKLEATLSQEGSLGTSRKTKKKHKKKRTKRGTWVTPGGDVGAMSPPS